MLGLLNDALQERKLDSQYVTMLFALWNDENQTLRSPTPAPCSPSSAAPANRFPSKPRAFRWACFPT